MGRVPTLIRIKQAHHYNDTIHFSRSRITKGGDNYEERMKGSCYLILFPMFVKCKSPKKSHYFMGLKMKKTQVFLSGLIFVFLLLSCEKNANSPSIQSSESFEKTSRVSALNNADVLQDIEDMALAVALSLKNDSFQTLVKSKASEKFDGDFDILLSDFVGQSLQDGKTVKNVLSENWSKKNKTIQMILDKNPRLQIAVYRCDEWTPKDYTPPVAYYNVFQDDRTIEQLDAFTNSGERIKIDAKVEYPLPMIIVDFNERMDRIEKTAFTRSQKNNDMKAVDVNVSSNAIWKFEINKLFVWDDCEPYYKLDAEMYSQCRVNSACTKQTKDLSNGIYGGSWYPINKVVFLETTCDDPEENRWTWIDLEIIEEDWLDPDDLVDNDFKIRNTNYEMTFESLYTERECSGRSRSNVNAIIFIERYEN